MKNIFEIFITDFKRIKSNVVAVVIILGLVILPSLYAWFNILSNWNPYGEDATSKIKVAFASKDEGAELEGIYFNIGDEVVEALRSNNTIGWVFTDTADDAIEGVHSGEYYAALIIPEGFTSELVSFLSEDMKHPEIIYYENEKKNAIAPKITSKAETAVQQQVNAVFISTLAKSMTDTVGTVMDADALKELGITETENIMEVACAKLESAMAQLDTYETLVDSFIEVTDSVLATGDAAEELNADDKLNQAGSSVSGVKKKVDTGISSKLTIGQSLSATLSSIQGLLAAVSSSYEEVGEDMDKFNASLGMMGINLYETKSLIQDMRVNLQESLDSIHELMDAEGYQMLMELMKQDPESVGSFIAEPVEIETIRIYPIENYGSAMAPFYTVLAIWVGSLILVAIIHVQVKPVKNLKINETEAYFGRYVTFFLVGQLQALLTVLGNLYFVRIQCIEPFKLWLAASTASFVFTILIYSLTFAFGNVGEAAAVVIMVIQVAGAGGTFPKEVLPEIYQTVYRYLPFPYAMDAMREAVGGMYEGYYWECILHLLFYVPVSVIIGIAGGRCFAKMNHLIEENKENSGVMM